MNLPSLEDVLSTLGIVPSEIEDIVTKHQPNWEAANDAFQAMVKSKRKEMAKKIHPDKGGDAEMMKTVNQYADLLIRNIRLGPRPQPRPQFVRIVVTNFNSSTSTTYGTGTGGFYF